MDRADNAKVAELAEHTYRTLAAGEKRPQILVTSPYGSLRENLPALLSTGVEALHLDLVHGVYSKAELESVSAAGVHLVAGIVNSRNVACRCSCGSEDSGGSAGSIRGRRVCGFFDFPAACAARPGSGRPGRSSGGRPVIR